MGLSTLLAGCGSVPRGIRVGKNAHLLQIPPEHTLRTITTVCYIGCSLSFWRFFHARYWEGIDLGICHCLAQSSALLLSTVITVFGCSLPGRVFLRGWFLPGHVGGAPSLDHAPTLAA